MSAIYTWSQLIWGVSSPFQLPSSIIWGSSLEEGDTFCLKRTWPSQKIQPSGKRSGLVSNLKKSELVLAFLPNLPDGELILESHGTIDPIGRSGKILSSAPQQGSLGTWVLELVHLSAQPQSEVSVRVDRGRQSAQASHAAAPARLLEVVACPVHAPVLGIRITNSWRLAVRSFMNYSRFNPQPI